MRETSGMTYLAKTLIEVVPVIIEIANGTPWIIFTPVSGTEVPDTNVSKETVLSKYLQCREPHIRGHFHRVKVPLVA